MKKVLSLVIAVMLMLTTLAGCGGKDEEQSSNTSSTSSASEGSTADAADNEPVTFTMYSVEPNAYPDGFQSPVAKEITKATGVTLNMEFAISTDAGKEKLALMAASGDYPDFVYGKDNLIILKNVNAIIKLDDLIDENAPNIKKFYGESDYKRLRWSKDDPSIYYFGGKEIGQENMEPTNGFQLQLSAVKELGYPKLKTLQDYENVIKEYVAKHPTTADGQKTIGLSLLADDWRFLITVSNPANYANGGPDNGEWYVDQNTFQCTRHLLRPEDREYFRWLNHMNDIGLLDRESFVQKYDQYKAKIASGRVVALADARWEIGEPVAALQQAGKADQIYGYFPLTMKEGQKYADFQNTGYLGGWGIAITDKCKDPVRAIKFFDWMCTEKAQILTHWGIEGEHYDVVDGKRVMKPEIIKMRASDPEFGRKTGISAYEYPFPTYGNTVKDSTGQYYEPFNTLESIISRQTPIENDVLSHYGVKAWKELYPQSSEFSAQQFGAAWLINIDDAEWKAADDKILKTGYKLIPAAILAKPEQFDAMYDKYVKALKDAGIDKVTSQFEKALKDRVELWK